MLLQRSIRSVQHRPLKKNIYKLVNFSIGAKTICMLSWCPRSRLFLQTKEVFTLLISLVDAGTKSLTQNKWTGSDTVLQSTEGSRSLLTSAAEWIAASFRYLLLGFGDEAAVDDLIDLGILRSLDKLNKLSTNDDSTSLKTCKSLVAAFRTLVLNFLFILSV